MARSEADSQVEGYFTGAYDFTRTNNPTENEVMLRVVCFCAAVKTGEIEIVDTLLQEGFDVNEVFENVDMGMYMRPLSCAILDEKFEMAKHLIAKGAEVGNAPFETPTFGLSQIASTMQAKPKRAIPAILLMDSFREIMKEAQGPQKPADIPPLTVFALARSPLTAACYVKSADLVEALLDAGAEFGEYYYIALANVFDTEKPCSEGDRERLLALVLSARDRIGFDRFVEANQDFEQYVNGEWRRGLAADKYLPAAVAQERAWRACDRLLTSSAYRKSMPMSQLLYAKYCDLKLDDIVEMILEVCNMIDSAFSLENLATILVFLNARHFCFRSLFPLEIGLVPNPATGKKALTIVPKWKNTDDSMNTFEIFKTVVVPLLQEEDSDIVLDLDEYDSVVDEIAVVGDMATAQSAMITALGMEHVVKDYQDLFDGDAGQQALLQSSLVIMLEPLLGEDDRPICFDEEAVRRVIRFLSQDNLGKIKNYMKCSYAHSFTFLIQAKATEQEPAARFGTFAAISGPLINDELSPTYLESILDDRAINELKEMFGNIKEAYRLAIGKSDYLSNESQTRALNKLDSIDLIIVGTDCTSAPLEGTLIIDDWNFVDNLNRLVTLFFDRELTEFLAGDDSAGVVAYGKAWDYNAAYSPQTNNVELYGAFLLPPTYSARRASVMNYASIGRVIGHELSHAFDPNSLETMKALGCVGDAVDIFSTSPTYAENIEKLKDQFRNKVPRRLAQAYPALLVHNEFDSDKCVGENFADIVGLEIALYAYALSCGFETIEGLVKDKPDDVRLFMQSYALSFREKPSLSMLQFQLMNDVHAPSEFRANTVKNLDAFHEIFGTEEGDGMWLDPEERVSVFGIK